MKLTVNYTAPLPPGFVSGTLELKSQTVYIDKDGLVNQPYYRAVINPDQGLADAQASVSAPLRIVGMGQGDPATASPLDVVVTMVVTGLPTPLRSTFRVIPTDTGGGNLNLHLPAIKVPVVGPPDQTLAQLIATAQGQVQQVSDGLDLLSFGLTLIPPAAQDARDAAAQARSLLNSRFVRNQAERTAFFNSLNGADGVVIQLDTREVWRQLAGLVEMIGLYTVDGTGPSTIYVYQNSITAAQKPGVFLDSVVTVCIIDSNDGPHGFPSPNCRVRTDRTGHNLTQFGQKAWDVQWVYDYFTPKSWWRVGDINSEDWGPFTQLTGPTGSVDKSAIGVSVAPLDSNHLVPALYLPPTPPLTPELLKGVLQPGPGLRYVAPDTSHLVLSAETGGTVPRLTGGTPGNFVVRVPGGWADAQETDLQGLQSAPVHLLGMDNVVRQFGADAASAGGYEGLRAGELVVLGGQRAKNGRNWYTAPAGSIPPAADAAAQAIVGQVVSRSAIAPIPSRVSFPSIVAPTVNNDGFTTNSDTNYVQPYGQGGGYYTANSKFTSGQSKVYFSEGNGKLTLYNRTPPTLTGAFQNLRLLFEGNHEGSNAPDYFLMNISGAYGAEVGYAVRVDSSTNTGQPNLAVGRWDGTKASGSKFIMESYFPLPWLAQNGAYKLELSLQRTRLVARAYPIGAAVPDWQIETFTADGNHGTVGVGIEQGAISLGKFDVTFGQWQVNPFFRETTDPLAPVNDGAPWDAELLGDSLSEAIEYAIALQPYFGKIVQHGIGGQLDDSISARAGGRVVLFTVAGNVIPPRGGVTVVPVNLSPLITTNFDRFVWGSLNGIYGKLSIVGSSAYSQTGGVPGTYTFTRAGTGPPVAVTGNALWQSETAIHRDKKVLSWQGRNRAGSAYMQGFVMQAAQEIEAAVRAAGGICFHLSILYADQPGERTTDADHTTRDRITATNAALAAFAGNRFIDVTTPLCTGPGGVAPAAYRLDALHMNQLGYNPLGPVINGVTSQVNSYS